MNGWNCYLTLHFAKSARSELQRVCAESLAETDRPPEAPSFTARVCGLAGTPDRKQTQLGLRPVLLVSAQSAGLWLDTVTRQCIVFMHERAQTCLSTGLTVIAGNHRKADLLQAGTEPADKAQEAVKTG